MSPTSMRRWPKRSTDRRRPGSSSSTTPRPWMTALVSCGRSWRRATRMFESSSPADRTGCGRRTATVYLARDPARPHEPVALKRLPLVGDPAVVKRLRQEAEILASLDHPNIVKLRDVVDDGDGVTLVMEYAPGGSLADRLRSGGR